MGVIWLMECSLLFAREGGLAEIMNHDCQLLLSTFRVLQTEAVGSSSEQSPLDSMPRTSAQSVLALFSVSGIGQVP